VWKKYPKARLHLYNCRDKRMHETFATMREVGKWWPFLRSLSGPVQDINLLYNRVDMVASCLYPLYARVIEAFGAGKPIIAPGYRENDYPTPANSTLFPWLTLSASVGRIQASTTGASMQRNTMT